MGTLIASLLTLLLSVAITAPMLAAPGAAIMVAAPADRPNIIFILTDDLDAKSIAVMPKLKSLMVDRGVTFANYFVTYPLCCPSRASILRGQYPHNTQILGNRPPLGGFEKFVETGMERSTIATWMQSAGYRTGYFGKYLNGYPDRETPTHVPPGWDEWHSPAGGSPYSNFNYRMNENGRIVSYGSRPEDYLTDVLARKASEFITQSTQGRRPFFIHLSTFAPHAPATPAPRHADTFAGVTAPRPPSFNEGDVGDKPAWVRARNLLADRQIAQIDTLYRRRLQSLLAVDDLIGTLVDGLRASGQFQRTYVFFSSDNGFHLGEHRLPQGKNTAYDEDIRVPLIVIGPGVPEGRTLEHLAMNIDLAPTWTEIAGTSTPSFVDGRSLLPLLNARPPVEDQWRQMVLVEHYNQTRSSRRARAAAIPEYHALRVKGFSYVEYTTGEQELYDLRRDPYQLQNIYQTGDKNLVSALSARLAAVKRCVGAACKIAEDATISVIR